ncbi:hypothetical protein fugu_006912 [Takifugu bimaculatus]|uniref:Uncharacterized protein n=1 Tax=Takifugu bimaculatus TaxID=433685 RepID=A0A4Z2B2T8_9TELE|nr:hypothetical protein fugu_006912 [Takifugu bimaculatus]
MTAKEQSRSYLGVKAVVRVLGDKRCESVATFEFWFCSGHINQKTQFENPVMEAKKKLSAEAPSAAPPPAATSPAEEPGRGGPGFYTGSVSAAGNHAADGTQKKPPGIRVHNHRRRSTGRVPSGQKCASGRARRAR